MTDLSGAGVRVLVIGTATHPGPTLSSVPAIARTVAALEATLLTRCGVTPGNLRAILDPPDAHAMAAAIAAEARQAQTVLVVYFLGHGLLGPGDELYLAASGTDTLTPGLAAHQALPFAAVREALTACRAPSIVVVLDCCFSGRAGLGPGSAEPVFTLPAAHGLYLLASSEQLALAPEEQEHTTFTGALIKLLAQGDPRGPRQLRLDDVYDQLFRTLRAEGGPLPRRQAGDRSGELIVAANAAQPGPPEPAGGSGQPSGPQTPEQSDAVSPYLSLSAFGIEDAEYFFGRERLTADLVAAAARTTAGDLPLVVVGPSGAGKTSLLHAGLLARLEHGTPELPGSVGWPWIVFAPGEQPVRALAARLHPAGAAGAEDLRADPTRAAELVAALLGDRAATAPTPAAIRSAALTATPVTAAEPRTRSAQASSGGMASEAAQLAAEPDGQRLVLVVDQLEQLFTLCPSQPERTAFVQALSSIARPVGGARRALVVLALRADFYGHATAYQELVNALDGNQFLVGPMGLGELRAAIEGPAAAAGLRLDEGLADVILHELGAMRVSGPEAGTLPLLSHALWATWRRRSGARLTVAGYRASGGIDQAIATTADAVYTGLDPAGQAAMRRMLPRLVRVDDEIADTVRPIGLATLQQGLPDQAAAEHALSRLIEARLVTLDQDTARISHEALLRAWPLLRTWIEADREWLRNRQQITVDAAAWRSAGRDPSLLYRGGRLAATRERVEEAARADELEPLAAEFLGQSSWQQRRAARRRTATIVGLVVLLLLASVGGVTAALFQRRAVAQRNIALARLIASEAESVRGAQPGLAKQLSLVAYQLDHDSGEGAIYASQQSPGVFDGDDPAIDLAAGAGGRLAISTGEAIALWDMSGHGVGRIENIATGAVAFRADGRLLAAATGPASAIKVNPGFGENVLSGQLDQVRLWAVDDPAHPKQLASLPVGGGNVTALAQSPDGQLLVTATTRGAVRVWDISRPHSPKPLPALNGHTGPVDSLAFAPTGRTLASSGTDPTVRLWSLADPAHPVLLSRMAGSQLASTTAVLRSQLRPMLHRAAFGMNGRHLAAVASDDKQEYVQVWDLVDPRHPRLVTKKPDDTCNLVVGLAFTMDSRIIAKTCDGGLGLSRFVPSLPPGRNLLKGGSLGRFGGGDSAVISVPGESQLLEATGEGVRQWDVSDPWRPGVLASLQDAPGGFTVRVVFSPAGRRLLAVTGGPSGTQLWDIADPREPRLLAEYGVGDEAEGQAFAGSVGFSPDGGVLATGEVDHHRPVVRLRRTANPTARPFATITDLDNGALALAFSPDRVTLAVVDNSLYDPAVTKRPTIKLFDIRDPARPRRLASPRGDAFELAISPDGRLLTAYSAREVLSWDVTDPRRPVALPTHRLTFGSLVADGAFRPDGRALAVGDSTGALRLWRVEAGRLVGDPVLIRGHGSPDELAFSPDGKTLAVVSEVGTASNDTVALWDISDPTIPILRTHLTVGSSVDAIAFSRDGQILATKRGETVDLWDTDPDRVAGALCDAAGDTITAAQWKQHVPNLPYRPPCG